MTKGFDKTEGGLYYKITPAAEQGRKVELQDIVTVDIKYGTKDTTLFDSKSIQTPAELMVGEPVYKSDIMEGFIMLHEGDEAVFITSADSFFTKAGGIGIPPGINKTDYLVFEVKVNKSRSIDELRAEKAALAEEQKAAEAKKIAEYMTKYYPGVSATPSGLYYVETNAGKGRQAENGLTVKVHYTGTLLTGETFDSSWERNQPIEFKLGAGRVIRGWEEGIARMREGTTATFIIPSNLAYGGNPPPGSIIQAYSPLRFDVELIEVR